MESGDPDTAADLSDTAADSDFGDHIDWDIAAVSGARVALFAIAVGAQSLAVCAANLAGAANLGPDAGLYAANLGPGAANLDPDNPDVGGSATTGLDVDSSDQARARMYANLANPFWAVDVVSTIGLDDRFGDLVLDDKRDRSGLVQDSDSAAFGLLQDNMAPDLLCAEVAPAAELGRPGEECLVAVAARDFWAVRVFQVGANWTCPSRECPKSLRTNLNATLVDATGHQNRLRYIRYQFDRFDRLKSLPAAALRGCCLSLWDFPSLNGPILGCFTENNLTQTMLFAPTVFPKQGFFVKVPLLLSYSTLVRSA